MKEGIKMSTHAAIIMKENDVVNGITCNFDGDLNHVGKILKEHYTDKKKVEALILLGNISSLDESIECPEGHTWENPMDGYTVAYTRDRGEPYKKLFNNEFATLRMMEVCSYNYLYEDGKWYLVVNRNKLEL